MRYLLAILLAVFSLSLYSEIIENKEKSIMEVYYTKITEKDTVKRHIYTESTPMTLRIGPTASMFFATKQLWSDSLGFYDINTQLDISELRYQSGDPDWWKLSGTSEWEYIFKNMPETKLTATCLFDQEKRFYEEPWQKPQWEILDSSKTILGYECIRASTSYRGRKWTAWFTPEIAIQEGPWKLCGLPGLILEAYDDKRDYQFIATGIVYTDKLNVGRYIFCALPPTKMTRDKYFEHRHWYMNKGLDKTLEQRQLSATLMGLEPPRTIADLNIDTTVTQRRDFEEIDYPHKWRKR